MKTGSRNFWVGTGIALATVIIYKTIPLKKEPEPPLPQENLTLLDLDYVPCLPPKPLEDFDLLFIKIQDTPNEEPELIKFSTFKGQPVILHFWATWCGPCVAELPSYNQFSKTSRIVNIGVCLDKTSPSGVRQFCQSKSIDTLKIAVDQNSVLGKRFGAATIPTSVFINAKGQEVGRIVGPVVWDDPKVARLLEKQLTSGS